MSYAKYESYKDSGVDWLGEIPSDWDLVPLRAIFRFRNEKNNPVITENILSLSIAKGVTGYDDENRGGNKRKDDITAYKIARPNDIVLNSMNVIVGAVGVSKYFGAISPVYYALYAFNDLGYVPYFNWIFQNTGFQKGLLKYGKGILIKLGEEGKMNTIRMKISQDDLKVLQFPLPNFEKQTKIANFLDQKTAQIDQAIALKQQQIEKLNEYKQIVIQNAVTKGLNPNAPMKNSGVEWIGNIPEHWDVKKNTHLFNKIGSGTTPTSSDLSYYDSGDINWLQTGDLNNDYIVATSRKINQKAMSKFSSLKLYDENSLVIAMYGATIGKVGLLKIKSTTNQACCVLGNSDKVFMKYIFYVMQFAKNHLISNSYGGGQPNINQDMIKNLRIPYPNLQEQEKIANYLDDLNEKIYKTSKGYQTQIDRLKEYKNILINQAVTGKIKI